jgi:hypothetical protein
MAEAQVPVGDNLQAAQQPAPDNKVEQPVQPNAGEEDITLKVLF